AVAVADPHADQRADQGPTAAAAGAVGRGREGAGDRLLGPGADVGEREAGGLEGGDELVERGAAADPDQAGGRIDRDDPAVVAEIDEHVLAEADVVEGVAAADRLDVAALPARPLDQRADLVLARRRGDLLDLGGQQLIPDRVSHRPSSPREGASYPEVAADRKSTRLNS